MTTAKTEGNKRNALRSTGPRTPAGKTRSSKNALRHGLLSRELLLQDESREDLEAFRARLLEDLDPVGELEELLADRVVSAAWRLRRAVAVEAGLFTPRPSSSLERLLAEDFGTEEPEEEEGSLACVLSYQFRNDPEVFSKLARYEAALERSLYRALHELERLQERRGGAYVPPPAVLDVEVSGAGGA